MQVLPISHVPSLSWQRERREWMPGVKIKGKHQIVGRILGQNREVYLGTWLVHLSQFHTHLCQERLAKSRLPFIWPNLGFAGSCEYLLNKSAQKPWNFLLFKNLSGAWTHKTDRGYEAIMITRNRYVFRNL